MQTTWLLSSRKLDPRGFSNYVRPKQMIAGRRVNVYTTRRNNAWHMISCTIAQEKHTKIHSKCCRKDFANTYANASITSCNLEKSKTHRKPWQPSLLVSSHANNISHRNRHPWIQKIWKHLKLVLSRKRTLFKKGSQRSTSNLSTQRIETLGSSQHPAAQEDSVTSHRTHTRKKKHEISFKTEGSCSYRRLDAQPGSVLKLAETPVEVTGNSISPWRVKRGPFKACRPSHDDS